MPHQTTDNNTPLPFEAFDISSIEASEKINDTLKLLPIDYEPGARSREMISSFSQKYLQSNQDFKISGIIGEGGMGIVYLGQEHLPERQVAIKKLKPEKTRLAKVLLKEALTMGSLNHPNVPPVYQVQFDEENRPEVVMRKIEGGTFQDMLKGVAQTDSKLREALSVLIQVCHAVEFAHSQGFLHRDIKPENIMVGKFNQVYLMDWGIAINLNDEHENSRGLAGTPSYMAPEMLCGNPKMLAPTSDIFLLGATLHEILTGKPRNSGSQIKQALTAAHECKPYSYSKQIPKPLADLCNWACAKEPTDRPQTASIFKKELEDFLNHWEALKLIEKGNNTLQQYKELWETEKNSDRINPLLLNQLAYQAKFSFEQAREIWIDVAGVEEGLTETVELMIHQALQTDQKQSALLLYQEYSLYFSKNTKLKDMVHQAFLSLEEKKQNQLELKKLEKALDPTITLAPRHLLIRILMVSVLISVASYWLSITYFDIIFDSQSFFYLMLLTDIPTWLAIIFLYKRLTINSIGRQALRTILFGTVGLFLTHFIFWQAEAPLELLASIDCIVVSLVLMNSAPAIKRGSRLALLALLTSVLCLIFPPQGQIFFGLLAIFVGAMIFLQWNRLKY